MFLNYLRLRDCRSTLDPLSQCSAHHDWGPVLCHRMLLVSSPAALQPQEPAASSLFFQLDKFEKAVYGFHLFNSAYWAVLFESKTHRPIEAQALTVRRTHTHTNPHKCTPLDLHIIMPFGQMPRICWERHQSRTERSMYTTPVGSVCVCARVIVAAVKSAPV